MKILCKGSYHQVEFEKPPRDLIFMDFGAKIELITKCILNQEYGLNVYKNAVYVDVAPHICLVKHRNQIQYKNKSRLKNLS